jgi:hypothetical protein
VTARLSPNAHATLDACLQVKSNASNQEAFQCTDGFTHLLNEEKRRDEKLKEEEQQPLEADAKEKPNDRASFLTWYHAYLFGKFDPSTAAKVQVRTRSSQDSL